MCTLALTIIGFAQNTHTPLASETDSVSYAVGINLAKSLMGGGIDSLNYQVMAEAIEDIMEHNHSTMDVATANQLVNDYLAKKKEEAAAQIIATGTSFLEENAKKDGVVTLPSGLQYKVITEGTGAKPVDGQTVKAHYKGAFLDGKTFDSSYDRGQPLSIGVNQVIAGWTQALKLMPVGSKWELYIPYNLAYGERGSPPKIPGYSTLIFTVELLEIVQ